MIKLEVKNLGIIYHKRPGSNKPKLYLESLIHEGGGRFWPPDCIPESVLKEKNLKKTVPESHPILMWYSGSGWGLSIVVPFQPISEFCVWLPKLGSGPTTQKRVERFSALILDTCVRGWRVVAQPQEIVDNSSEQTKMEQNGILTWPCLLVGHHFIAVRGPGPVGDHTEPVGLGA